jgi:hypothetical protein
MEEKEILEQFKINSKNENWEFGNNVLYGLCENNFEHTDKSKVIAKIWIIGRSYAVAIERRKTEDKMQTEEFYNFMADKFIKFNLENNFDENLRLLKNQSSLKKYNLQEVLRLNNS